MKTYDWIVVGGGITGAALSYELAIQGSSVLLLEQHAALQGASRYSYGGLAYWSGTTPLTRQLAAEGRSRYLLLSQELEADTQLRELNLLLTIKADTDPQTVVKDYQQFDLTPQLLDPATACQVEPRLNPQAISGALQLSHGHINPLLTTLAYTKAMQRHGGEIYYEQVVGLISRRDRHISGVSTAQADYHAHGVIICAGGFSRALLKTVNISIPLYFTHAESIEVSPAETKEIKLSSIITPASLQRIEMEAIASTQEHDHLWEQENHELAPPIMDAGALQFQDQSLRLGQISRVLSNPHAKIDAVASEAQMRHQIGEILPDLASLRGTWYHCLVAYCRDYLPLIGGVADYEGLHIFSGFSNPLVFVPPLAQRFSKYLTGNSDDIIDQLSPSRFKE